MTTKAPLCYMKPGASEEAKDFVEHVCTKFDKWFKDFPKCSSRYFEAGGIYFEESKDDGDEDDYTMEEYANGEGMFAMMLGIVPFKVFPSSERSYYCRREVKQLYQNVVIQRIAVPAHMRRMGVCTAVFRHVEEASRAVGLKHVSVQAVNEVAMAQFLVAQTPRYYPCVHKDEPWRSLHLHCYYVAQLCAGDGGGDDSADEDNADGQIL